MALIVLKKKTPPVVAEVQKYPNADGMFRAACPAPGRGMVSWWLMASYLKMRVGRDLLSPALYKEVASTIRENRGSIVHQHLDKITDTELRMANLSAWPVEKYPSIVRAAAVNMARGVWEPETFIGMEN